jgi:hypothetical protein
MRLIITLTIASIVSQAHGQLGAKAVQLTISSPSGTPIVLSNCVVTRIEPDGVRVSHDSGFAKVPYKMMPAVWRNSVLIDEKAAKEFREKAALEGREALLKAEQEMARQTQEAANKNNAITGKNRSPKYAFTWVDNSADKKKFAIMKVEVISVLPQGLLVHRLQPTAPRADRMTSVGGGGSVAPGGYEKSGTKVLLKGKLPPNPVDGMIFSVQAEKTGTTQLNSETDVQSTISVYDSIAHDSKE